MGGTKGYFTNNNVAEAAATTLGPSNSTVYVFLSALVNDKKPTIKDFRESDKARYMFSTGSEHGSLVDLILNKHGITFPMEQKASKRVWETPGNNSSGTRKKRQANKHVRVLAMFEYSCNPLSWME